MATFEKFPNLPALPNVTSEWVAQHPEVDTPVFESDTVRFYFLLFEILKYVRENPLYTQNAENGTYDANTDNINSLTLLNVAREVDTDDTTLVLSERTIVDDFFTTVIDQPVFNSQDHLRFRQFLMDWYASQRALVTRSKKSVDPYQLPSTELDDLFRGFGFDYSYILDRDEKAALLYQLISYYQSKGSPTVFSSILTFFGVINVTLSEWWLEVVSRNGSTPQLYMRNRPIWTPFEKTNPDIYNEISYLPFVQSDPHWYYDKPNSDEHIWDLYTEIDTNPDSPNYGGYKNQISLPSITPYLTIDNKVRHNNVIPELAILNRKSQEAFEYWCKYILSWGGDATTAPTASTTANTVVRVNNESDYVYNGTAWVNLGTLLPDHLVMSDSTCAPEFNPVRAITLNLSRLVPGTVYNSATGTTNYVYEEFSFFEAMLGAYYLLGLEYIPNLKRMTADVSSNLPDLALYNGSGQYMDLDPTGSYLVECTDTDTDWIWWKGEWHNLLTQLTDYQDTNGYFSYCVFIPKTGYSDADRYLYYTGTYTPLDSTHAYVDGTTGETVYVAGVMDGIDDVSYSEILAEYAALVERPTNIPISSEIMFGADGTDHPETYWRYDDIIHSDYDHHYYLGEGKIDYHSTRQERARRLAILNERFYAQFADPYANDSTSSIYRGWAYNPMPFLEAASPSLATALQLIAYDCGISDLRGEQKLKREREKYFLSLSLYLKEIGLKRLVYLSNLLLGYALSDIIKQIITFFKPYRARFKSFLTEYIIDDAISDGAYSADHPSITSVNQIVPEDVNPQDAIHIRRTQSFVDYAHSPYFDESYLMDVMFTTIKMTIDEHVNATDDLVLTTHLLEHDDVAPGEQFGYMRATDDIDSGSATSLITVGEAGAVEVWENGTLIADLSEVDGQYGPSILDYSDSTAINTQFRSTGFYTANGSTPDASLTQWSIDPNTATLILDDPTYGDNIVSNFQFLDWTDTTTLTHWTTYPNSKVCERRTMGESTVGLNLLTEHGSSPGYISQSVNIAAESTGYYLVNLEFITSNCTEAYISLTHSDTWWTGTSWDSSASYIALESVQGQITDASLTVNFSASGVYTLTIHGLDADNSILGLYQCEIRPIASAATNRDLVYYIGAQGTNISKDYNFRYWDDRSTLDSTSWTVDTQNVVGAVYEMSVDMANPQYGPYCVKNTITSGTANMYVAQTLALEANTPYQASFYSKTLNNSSSTFKTRIGVLDKTELKFWLNSTQTWGVGGLETNESNAATNTEYEESSMYFTSAGANNYQLSFMIDSVPTSYIDRCFVKKLGIDTGNWVLTVDSASLIGSVLVKFLAYDGSIVDSGTISETNNGRSELSLTVGSDPVYAISFHPTSVRTGGVLRNVEFKRVFTTEI